LFLQASSVSEIFSILQDGWCVHWQLYFVSMLVGFATKGSGRYETQERGASKRPESQVAVQVIGFFFFVFSARWMVCALVFVSMLVGFATKGSGSIR
jgi:hypothetical protein